MVVEDDDSESIQTTRQTMTMMEQNQASLQHEKEVQARFKAVSKAQEKVRWMKQVELLRSLTADELLALEKCNGFCNSNVE